MNGLCCVCVLIILQTTNCANVTEQTGTTEDMGLEKTIQPTAFVFSTEESKVERCVRRCYETMTTTSEKLTTQTEPNENPTSEQMTTKSQQVSQICSANQTEPPKTKLLVIGGNYVGYSRKPAMEEFYPNNPESNKVIDTASVQTSENHASGQLPNGQVLITGGHVDLFEDLNTTQLYDPNTGVVTQGPELNTQRRLAGNAVLGDAFYVCGGRRSSMTGRTEILSSCERYRENDTQWHYVASLIIARENLQMLSVDCHLYAIGGEEKDTRDPYCACQVERYDSKSDTWTMARRMRTGRIEFGAAVLDGKIFACGGKAFEVWQSLPLADCEVYNPATDTWTQGASMKNRRRSFVMAALGGKLYVASDAWSMGSREIEEFDPEKNEWKVLEFRLRYARAYGSMIAV